MRAWMVGLAMLLAACSGGGGAVDGGVGGGSAGGGTGGGGTGGGLGGGAGGGAGGGGVGGGSGMDGGSGTDGGSGMDGGAVGLIGEVLTCGKLGMAGGLAPGNELQRHDFDTTEFPDALCNDGTPALFYFRPASSPQSRNRWLIQLQGGGSCESANSCAQRWCSEDTAFGMQGMSARPAPAAINARGIFERRADNPFGTWNHVFLKYCSSDQWAGTRRDVVVNGVDPLDGGPRTYRLHVLGTAIIDAATEVLRRDAGTGLVFTLGDAGTPLADLDDAEIVVLAGASGGGAGTINNADRLRALLRATNTNCQGASCPLVFRALIDSIIGPSLETLDFSTSVGCDAGICDYVTMRNVAASTGGPALWGMREDESCVSWHQANAPTLRNACNDVGHVMRNHLVTPFFVRQGQTDQLISSTLLAQNFSVPDGGVLDLVTYAQLVQQSLRALDTISATAEEGSAITVTPGAFGPTCSEHETLSDATQVYGVYIDGGAAGPLALFDVMQNWVTGVNPYILVANGPADNVCP
ncbi:MAG: pectin acetylesterase-family hydrolase [Myxococcota bacterium]